MMTLLSKHAIICLEAVCCDFSRNQLIEELTNPDLNPEGAHEILELSHKEIFNMCANMFDVLNLDNEHCVIMSKRAAENFTGPNFEKLQNSYKLVISDVTVIEDVGGGSCRCLLAEKF